MIYVALIIRINDCPASSAGGGQRSRRTRWNIDAARKRRNIENKRKGPPRDRFRERLKVHEAPLKYVKRHSPRRLPLLPPALLFPPSSFFSLFFFLFFFLFSSPGQLILDLRSSLLHRVRRVQRTATARRWNSAGRRDGQPPGFRVVRFLPNLNRVQQRLAGWFSDSANRSTRRWTHFPSVV